MNIGLECRDVHTGALSRHVVRTGKTFDDSPGRAGGHSTDQDFVVSAGPLPHGRILFLLRRGVDSKQVLALEVTP